MGLRSTKPGTKFYGTNLPLVTVAQIKADAVARGIHASEVIAAAVEAFALPESKALAAKQPRPRPQAVAR